MKMLPKLKKAASAFLAALLLLLSLSVPAMALPYINRSQSGSITINMSGTGTGLDRSGIKFTLYKVADLTGTAPIWYTLTPDFSTCGLDLQAFSTASSSAVAAEAKTLEGYVSSKNLTGVPSTTDSKGTAQFKGLSLGYYLVVPDQSPKSQVSFCDPFLFTVPMAGGDGNSWIYDITANTKCQDQAGAVILKKVNSAGTLLPNAVFRLDKKVYYTDPASIPQGYQTFSDSAGNYFWSTSVSDLTTSLYGEISVMGMAFGQYRFVELTPPSGYRLDATPHEFTIYAAGAVTLVNGLYVPVTGTNVQTITVVNYPPSNPPDSSRPHHPPSDSSSSFPPDSSPSSISTSSLPDNSIPMAPPTESIPDENVPKSGFDLPKTGGSIAYGLCTYGGIILAVCGVLTFLLSRKKKT